MASNQTANFGLNQWEATDKVLREEFNADNAKIDAAIKALQLMSPVEWILDTVTTASKEQYNLDVSGVDFTKYRAVTLYLEPSAATTTTAMYVRLNGMDSYRNSSTTIQNYLASIGLDSNGLRGHIGMHLLLGSGMISGYVEADYMTSKNQYIPAAGDRLIAVLAPDSLNVINFISQDSGAVLGAGTRFKMFGIKK